MDYYYRGLYVKPALLDSGMSSSILDGPLKYPSGTIMGVKVLSNFSKNDYTNDEIKSYVVPGEEMTTYQINSDVVYFQIFPKN